MSDLLRVVERSKRRPDGHRGLHRPRAPGERGRRPDRPASRGAREPLRASCARRPPTSGTAQHEHPFVRGIGDGTLPEAALPRYVRQDYLFLIDYGRLLALGAARAPRLDVDARASPALRDVRARDRDGAPPRARGALGDRGGRARGRARRARPPRAYSTSCCAPRRSATSPSSPRRCCRACGATRRSASASRAAGPPTTRATRSGSRSTPRRVRASSPPGAASSTDAAGAGLGEAGVARMHAAFRASSEHELGVLGDGLASAADGERRTHVRVAAPAASPAPRRSARAAPARSGARCRARRAARRG